MDTFFEQIISIKKSGKAIACLIGLWVLAALLCFGLTLFISYIGSFIILLIAGIIYGGIKLSGLINLEYEYIVTNGTMDVDRITNKSSRKRILTFELSGVTRLEKYHESILNNINKKDVVFACNPTDESYLIVAEKEGSKPSYLVFAPNDKMKSAIVKFVPKFISNSAFK